MTLEVAVLAGIALAAGSLGTRLARALISRTGVVNHPNPLVPRHVRAIAYLGGVGIALGFGAAAAVAAAAALPLWSIAPAHARGFAVGAIGLLLLGCWDDVRPLRRAPKLLAQLAVAVGAAAVALPDAGLAALALATLWLAVTRHMRSTIPGPLSSSGSVPPSALTRSCSLSTARCATSRASARWLAPSPRAGSSAPSDACATASSRVRSRPRRRAIAALGQSCDQGAQPSSSSEPVR